MCCSSKVKVSTDLTAEFQCKKDIFGTFIISALKGRFKAVNIFNIIQNAELNEKMLFWASFVHIVEAEVDPESVGDNEMKLLM